MGKMSASGWTKKIREGGALAAIVSIEAPFLRRAVMGRSNS